nr:hypothetical protein [Bacillus pseudomycoides]
MEEKPEADDSIYLEDVLTGKRTDAISKKSLYIADPRNAMEAFTVNVYAVL